MRAAARPSLVLGCASLAACVSSGLPDAELSDHLIAVHYRTETEARRRAQDLAEAGEVPPGGAGGVPVAGHKVGLHAHLGELGRFFHEALGRGAGSPSEGRLALLDPRSRELRFVAGARRGAVPLAWSPDGRRLLFSQPGPEGEALQVFEWLRASGEIRQVTRGPALHPQACYAAEGRIAVVRVEGRGQARRARVLLSGPGGRRPFAELSPGPADHSPACTPASLAVVLQRERAGGHSELWRAHPGEGLRRLGPGSQPRFQRDGSWLVYSARYRGSSRLFRVRADGRGRAALGRGGLDESWPAPCPEGAHVVYVAAEEPSRRHLYVRRVDGSGDRILFADGDAEYPVW